MTKQSNNAFLLLYFFALFFLSIILNIYLYQPFTFPLILHLTFFNHTFSPKDKVR
jgi:hypothetical protein